MGRFTKFVGSAIAIAPLATLGAQSTPPLAIAAPSFTAYAGTNVPLRLDITDSVKVRQLAVRTPSWESSDPTRAWVTPQGVVVLLEPGRVKVRARMGNFVAERELDVRKANVEQLTLRAKGSASAGEPIRIDAAATDQEHRPMTGARANLAVVGEGATIDDDGRFVGQIPGSYLVVAELGGKTTTQRIDVTGTTVRQQASPSVSSFEIRAPKFEPYTQTALQLSASPSGVNAGALRWGVSDSTIASVSQTGMLELRKPGNVRVWATTPTARAEREFRVLANPAADVALRLNAENVHVGDAVHVAFDAWARGSHPVENARVLYAVAAVDAPSDGAHIREDGTFIARAPGVYTIIAALGSRADQQTIIVR